MLTKREEKILKHILELGKMMETSRSYRYSFVILIVIIILLGIFSLIIGFIFKADEIVIYGISLWGIGVVGGSYIYRDSQILYNAIKKIYTPSNEFYNNKSSSGCALIVMGAIFIFGGLMLAFRDELMYLSTGAKFFLKLDPFDIPFKIIGFTMTGIGFLIIIIPPIIRRWRG